MPQVADFSDVVALFSTADLQAVTLERWVPGVVRKGTAVADPAANRYGDVGALDPCFWVPDGSGEGGQDLPGGNRARERIRAFTTTQVRAGRNPAARADVLRLADGRRYQATTCKPWGVPGSFYEVVAELVDE